MEGIILVILSMIKKKDMEYSNGPTGEYLMGSGRMENNMEKEPIYYLIRKIEEAFGKMA
jgi:hypothetical protein